MVGKLNENHMYMLKPSKRLSPLRFFCNFIKGQSIEKHGMHSFKCILLFHAHLQAGTQESTLVHVRLFFHFLKREKAMVIS